VKKIAVLSSGGDAPGMNAGIRAAVRASLHRGLAVFGVQRGYEGLVDNLMRRMESRDVSNILQHGGTILHSARSDRFMTPQGRALAAANLAEMGIDGLVVFGGDGSFRGAHDLSLEHGVEVVGVPATIDNDIWGTDFTIGYDTAVNTALSALDKVRDTAAAHDRLFIVEVMGRHAGFIALEVAVGAGAEAVFVPETPNDIPGVCEKVKQRVARGKTSNILVVAEGDEDGNAYDIAKRIEKHSGLKSRVTVLGHVQRGGSPTTSDRVLATKLGWAAVDALINHRAPCMVGVENGILSHHPLQDTWVNRKHLDPVLLQIMQEM
jgi:6-phosphofructokinase 1